LNSDPLFKSGWKTLYIGQRWDGYYKDDATKKQFAIWSTALTEGEIRKLATGTTPDELAGI